MGTSRRATSSSSRPRWGRTTCSACATRRAACGTLRLTTARRPRGPTAACTPSRSALRSTSSERPPYGADAADALLLQDHGGARTVFLSLARVVVIGSFFVVRGGMLCVRRLRLVGGSGCARIVKVEL